MSKYMPHQYAKLFRDLKGKCVNYVTDYLEEDFKESDAGRFFAKNYEVEDGIIVGEEDELSGAWAASIDNFLLFGETLENERVLNIISKKAKKLTAEEKEILADWEKKAFDSVFEIVDMDENKLKLFDVLAEVEYDAYSNSEESLLKLFPEVEKGSFMYANLVPIKNFWFLSGAQKIFSSSAEQIIFENFVQRRQSPQDIYRNNPDKLKKALKLQKEIYDFFVEFYGSDEIIISGDKLAGTQREFYSAWSRHSGGKETPKENIFPKEIEEADSVGIIMDQKQGEYFAIDYKFFVDTFSKSDERQSGWQIIIVGYLEDEYIPAFIFERMKNRYPEGFRKVMSDIFLEFNEGNLDPVNDFDFLMDEYKPGWKETYPSVCLTNERFKKYYYQNRVGRNEPCPCGSGKKFKKCCGR